MNTTLKLFFKIQFYKKFFRLFKDAKIKAKLIAGFVSLAFIPLLITGYFSYTKASSIITDKISNFSIQLTNQVAKEIYKEISNMETEATRIITMKETNDLLYQYSVAKKDDKWSVAQQLNEIMRASALSKGADYSVMLLDSNLDVIYSSFYGTNENEKFYDKQELKNILNKTKDHRVFTEAVATIKKVKVPVIIKPIPRDMDNDKIIGYNIISLDKSFLERIYKGVDLGDGTSVFVVNSSYELVSSSNPDDVIGNNIKKNKDYLKLEDENGLNIQTVDKLITYSNVANSKVSRTNLYLVAEIPIKNLTKESKELGIYILYLGIACLIVAIIVSYLLSNQISLPLSNLVRNMKEAERGNLITTIDVLDSKDEIGEVTRGFKDMLENISTLVISINTKNVQLNLTLDELKKAQEMIVESEKMAALGKLVAGVAHEINTPLGAGITAASFLDTKTIEINDLINKGNIKLNEMKSYLRSNSEAISIIITELNKASEIIQSFKQIAVDQSEQEIRLFDMKEYLGQILLSLTPKLRSKKHNIVIKCEEGLKINSYPGAIYQILSNLIYNSLNHAFTEDIEGHICIEASTQDNSLSLKFSDDGIGIPKGHLKEIFEPFYTTNRGNGAKGLGLSIVYNNVSQSLKGSIICESEIGEGTTFTISIPNVTNARNTGVDN